MPRWPAEFSWNCYKSRTEHTFVSANSKNVIRSPSVSIDRVNGVLLGLSALPAKWGAASRPMLNAPVHSAIKKILFQFWNRIHFLLRRIVGGSIILHHLEERGPSDDAPSKLNRPSFHIWPLPARSAPLGLCFSALPLSHGGWL